MIDTISNNEGGLSIRTKLNSVITKINGIEEGGTAFDPANPGPIGDTTPAAGSFADLTASGIVVFSRNGTLSQPSILVTGSPITGGTGTTTAPLMLIQPSGSAAVTNWSTSGTMLGVVVPSGFNGDALRLQSSTSATTAFRVNLDQSSGALFFGAPGAGLALFGGNLYPEEVNNAGLGRLGVSAWINLYVTDAAPIQWGSDTRLSRDSAGILRLTAGASGGAALQGEEQTAPAAPPTNGYRIYAEDNGGGKTRLMVRFATGAAQQLAIEP